MDDQIIMLVSIYKCFDVMRWTLTTYSRRPRDNISGIHSNGIL